MQRERVIWSFLFLAGLLFAPTAFAECVPNAATDSCAPSKKLGEWDTSSLVGLNLTRGNSETLLFTVGAQTLFDDNKNIWNINGYYSFGEDESLDTEESKNGSTSRNDLRSGARYDRIIDDSNWFVGAGGKFLYDEIADIDYRANGAPNVGYFLLKDNSFKFKLEGGPGYVFERVGGIDNSYFSPRVGDRFDWAITCNSKLYQQAEILFDTEDSQNYIVNSEAGIESAISTNLALVVMVRDVFDNTPAEGKDRSDLTMISALKITL